jgi:hypothetical protein
MIVYLHIISYASGLFLCIRVVLENICASQHKLSASRSSYVIFLCSEYNFENLQSCRNGEVICPVT